MHVFRYLRGGKILTYRSLVLIDSCLYGAFSLPIVYKTAIFAFYLVYRTRCQDRVSATFRPREQVVYCPHVFMRHPHVVLTQNAT